MYRRKFDMVDRYNFVIVISKWMSVPIVLWIRISGLQRKFEQ